VGNESSKNIYGYKIDPSTGALTGTSQATINTIVAPTSMAISQ
jgi:hypothetical protein